MEHSGFILLDKAVGKTSFQALFPLKKIFGTKRVGHAGTLDLRASGLIIAGIGRATRLLPFLEAESKSYSFRLHFGYETDTLEWDGELTQQSEAVKIEREDLENILPAFTGHIKQVPPDYSAVKVSGTRASDLMLRGKDFELPARAVEIERLTLTEKLPAVTEGFSGKFFAEFDFECDCSKGTYIRSLGRDIGRALGSFASVSQIRRTRIGQVSVREAHAIENITQANLLPIQVLVPFPVLTLTPADLAVIRNGNWIPWKQTVNFQEAGMKNPENYVFVAGDDGQVTYLCRYEPGRILPRIFVGNGV